MGRWSGALSIVFVLISASKSSNAFSQKLFAGPILRLNQCSFVHSAIKKGESSLDETVLNEESNDGFIVKNLESDLDIDTKLDTSSFADFDTELNVDSIHHNAYTNDHAQERTKVDDDGVVPVDMNTIIDEENDVIESLPSPTLSDVNVAVLNDMDVEEVNRILDIEEIAPSTCFNENTIVEEGVVEVTNIEALSPPPPLQNFDDTLLEADIEEELVDILIDIDLKDAKEDFDMEAHPPLPPADESVIQAHENDVEEESTTLLEEQISMLMTESAATAVGSEISRFYVSCLQRIQDCKINTEKSIARSVYEKDKAAEKIAKIKAKAEKQIEEIEATLSFKLDDAHIAFNSQKADIMKTLKADIEKETMREGTMAELTKNIDAVLQSKQNDVADGLKITEDIVEVRSKISQGKVAVQLDDVLKKKNILLSLENQLIEELNSYKKEAESVIKEVRRRKRKMEKLFETIELPSIATGVESDYDFSQIKEIELLMREAAKSANQSNKNLIEIKSRFDKKLLERMECAGEPIPDSLKVKEKRKTFESMILGSKSKLESNIGQHQSHLSSDLEELNDKNEQEIASLLAKSIGNFAMSGTKASIFGVKALIETFKHDEVSAATREVMTKSSSLLSTPKNDTGSLGVNRNNNTSNIQDSLKSTSDTLGAVGKAGSAALKNIKSAPSASQATEALEETSKDFLSAFNAVRVLGMKSVEKINEQLSTNEDKE